MYDVDANNLIEEASKELRKEKEINPPEWSAFVKTGVHKERVPVQKDWWYMRSASLLRKLYVYPRGISKLRGAYGGRKNRGYKPERFKKASGSVIRNALQQLEKAGYVKKSRKGRELTPKGQKFLDNMAYKISKQ